MTRILQITDTHILGEPGREMHGVDSHASLRLVLEAAMNLPGKPDLVIVTGDLSEDASPESYRRLRELFRGLQLPVYVIPGNHDSVTQMKDELVGTSIRMERILDLAEWRLIFLDSTVPRKDHGRLDESSLRFLDEAIADAPEKPVFVCLHHGPFSPCVLDSCSLQDGQVFLDTLLAHENARLVVSGHVHTELHRRAAQLTLLASPSTFVQAKHPASKNDPAPHVLDNSRFGFRTIELKSGGAFESSVHWVPNGG